MGEFSIWHWLIVLLVVMLLFGSGKVSGLMGDFAKGIKAFKKNMADDTPESAAAEPAQAASAPKELTADPQREAALRNAHEHTPAH